MCISPRISPTCPPKLGEGLHPPTEQDLTPLIVIRTYVDILDCDVVAIALK